MLLFWSKKQFFKRDLKKGTFPLNFDIFGDIDKKRFFQNDLKNEKSPLSDDRDKKRFF